jgi:hypothetical protein
VCAVVSRLWKAGASDEHVQFLLFVNQIMRWRSEHLFDVNAPAVMSSRYCTMSVQQYVTTVRRLLGGLGGGARARSRRTQDVEVWLRGLPLMEHQRCLVVVRHLERWGVVAGGGLERSQGIPDLPMCIVRPMGSEHTAPTANLRRRPISTLLHLHMWI